VTKHITENTPLILRAGVAVALLIGVTVWFNNRLSAVEVAQAEQRSDIRHVLEVVLELKQAMIRQGKYP